MCFMFVICSKAYTNGYILYIFLCIIIFMLKIYVGYLSMWMCMDPRSFPLTVVREVSLSHTFGSVISLPRRAHS